MFLYGWRFFLLLVFCWGCDEESGHVTIIIFFKSKLAVWLLLSRDLIFFCSIQPCLCSVVWRHQFNNRWNLLEYCLHCVLLAILQYVQSWRECALWDELEVGHINELVWSSLLPVFNFEARAKELEQAVF